MLVDAALGNLRQRLIGFLLFGTVLGSRGRFARSRRGIPVLDFFPDRTRGTAHPLHDTAELLQRHLEMLVQYLTSSGWSIAILLRVVLVFAETDITYKLLPPRLRRLGMAFAPIRGAEHRAVVDTFSTRQLATRSNKEPDGANVVRRDNLSGTQEFTR